jgi:CHAT domain-containing protein/tetratricopeptide (TPR) repeat protein
LTRPFDKHLDSDELDRLVSLQRTSVSDSGRLLEPSLREAERHVESCQDCSQKLQVHKSVHSEILRMRAPNPSPPTPECMGDAEWLEVAAGLLPETKTRELMKHAAQCGHCGPLLKNAAEALVDEPTPSEEAWLASLPSARPEWRKNMAENLRGSTGSRASSGAKERVREKEEGALWRQGLFSWPRPAFALAGIVVAVLTGWLGLRMIRPPSAEQLLAQAYTEHRTLEVRIPGAKYAPIRVERSTGGSNLDKSPSLLKAESLIGENLRKSPNDPVWLQAKGRADLLDGNYESAIKSLQRALEIKPDDPTLLTDLGSAYFVRAETADRAIDYGNAVESLGKALAKSPDDPVALFNRALACEQIFLYTQAVDDWQHYLRIDPQGEWADEARKRLAAIQEKVKQHAEKVAEPLLTPTQIARANASDPALRSKIDDRIEDYLAVATTEWLPQAYPTAPQVNPSTAEARAALEVVADIAGQKHGDRWLMDLLTNSPSSTFPAAAAQLALALRANDFGNNFASREYARKAEGLFAARGDEAGALRARVEYVFASHDAQESVSCLEAARGQESRLNDHPYRWLAIQFYLEEGTCYRLAGNLGEARRFYERAAREAAAEGFGAIYLRAQDHLSSLNGTIGNLTVSWTISERALTRFWSGCYPPMRGYNLYYDLYESARIAEQPHLQIAVWRDGLVLSDSFNDSVLRAMAHSFMASAALAAEQPNVAEREFERSSELFAEAPQIKSTRIAHVEAETRLAEVETSQGNAQSAVSRLQHLEPEVSKLSDNLLAILFYTALGNADFELGNRPDAESSLRSAIAVSELHLRSLRDNKSRSEWSQITSSAYRNFVQLRLNEGDMQGALEVWEWYKGGGLRTRKIADQRAISPNFSLPAPGEIEHGVARLENQTFVSYAVLPRGLAIWVYDDRGVFGHWTVAKSSKIRTEASHFRRLCADANSDFAELKQEGRALYQLLVAPVEEYLPTNRTIVVELDDALSGLPFDALIDKQNHYFGDRVSLASSLGLYYEQRAVTRGPITTETPALVAVVSTSGAVDYSSVAPLPDALPEGEMVAQGFKAARLLAGNTATVGSILSELPSASVFHFAGHAISSQQLSGLLLSDAVLTASSLEKTSLSRMQLAVFSACDTEEDSAGGIADSDSLVRVFLSAGAGHVVASRWNVDSVATRQFMELFYRALLAGNTVSASMQKAQSSLRSRPGMSHPYYWSAFTAFGAV